MAGFKDEYQDVQPVTLRLSEENVTSSLYCSSARDIENHVSTLVEAFLVEVYRCRVCQFTSSQKLKISHHVIESHDPVTPCPKLPCVEKENEETLGKGISVDDEVEVEYSSSPYNLESDLHSGLKNHEDQIDMERISFLLPIYSIFPNISPRSCAIGLGSSSDGNMHVAQTCEVSTLFEESTHEDDCVEEPVFQLDDASPHLAVPLSGGMDTDVQDEEMAQSAHLMTLGLCRISSMCQPQTSASAKSNPEHEQEAGDAIIDAEMQKASDEDVGLACVLCQTIASDRSMLEVHLQCHSVDQGFRCPRCGWETEDWVEMELHWRTHGKRKNTKRHKCSFCPRSFKRVDYRDAHEKRHKKQRQCHPESGGLMQCSMCLEWCRSRKEWEMHQHCHVQDGFKCLHCDFKDKSWKTTVKHIQNQHRKAKKYQDNDCKRDMQLINVSAKYPECLRRMCSPVRKRIKSSVVNRQKTDEEGSDGVGQSKALGLTVSRRKEFCCNLCDKKFSSRLTMRRHMGIHQEEKPFKCPHCDYSTRLKASLIQHLRIHTGEKPYKCSQCSYASIDRSSLRRHSRTHTQEKPYCCQYCPYSSIQKKSLDLHSRRHHTGESFPCQLCQYTTPDRQLLVRHMRKLHSAEPTGSACKNKPSQRGRKSK